MSLLSGLFAEIDAPADGGRGRALKAQRIGTAPRLANGENVAATTNSAGPEGALPKKGSGPQSRPHAVARVRPDLHCRMGGTPSAHTQEQRGQPYAQPPQLADPHDDEPRHFIQTAVTASPEWLAARDALYHHLMPCRSCYAPMGRYCAAGAELRQRYDLTPMM